MFPLEEFLRISRTLEQHGILFNRLWEAGKPVFSDGVLSAGVRLNSKDDVLEFRINEKFWNSLDEYTKTFIVAHECAHIALRHGTRSASKALNMFSKDEKNVAMDIAINHLLCDYFGFDRAKLSCEKILCWRDTVFPGRNDILPNQTFEYYLSEMPHDACVDLPSPLDDHSEMSGEGPENWAEEQISNRSIGMSLDDGKEENRKLRHGDGSHLQPWNFPDLNAVPKKKWMSAIKKWNKKARDEEDSEQWTKINRRHAAFPSNFFLPTDNSGENFAKKKVEIFLFLDVSGSCSHAAVQFLKAAKSIPRQHFTLHTFAFDTHTRKIDLLGNSSFHGVGTNFRCIEGTLCKQKTYPELVWVFTDGEAPAFSTSYPSRWHWFLLPGGFTSSIPKQSTIHHLNEFE